MKVFLDTGNPDEIRQATDFGVVDGVTANPTLAAKEGPPFRELILEMCRLLSA
jgi:transaldolase